MKVRDRIEVDREVVFGKPRIAGTRLAVQFVLELLASDWSVDEVLKEYPHIKKEDVLACVEYAKELVEERAFFRLDKHGRQPIRQLV